MEAGSIERGLNPEKRVANSRFSSELVRENKVPRRI